MKKNKGFTLIELLAVIVILTIIALVAVPLILNIINRARKSAAEDAAYGVRKEGEIVYQFQSMTAAGVTDDITIEFGEDYPNGVQITSNQALDSNIKYELDGTMPTSGSIKIFKDGKIKGKVMINGYWCSIKPTGKIKCNNEEILQDLISYVSEDVDTTTAKIEYEISDNVIDATCKYGDDSTYNNLLKNGTIDKQTHTCIMNDLNPNTTYYYKITVMDDDDNSDSITGSIKTPKLFENGKIVYYDPVLNDKCSEQDYSENLTTYYNSNGNKKLSNDDMSPTGLKTGCMKWYAFNYEDNDTNVKLLLSHNTTTRIEWLNQSDYEATGKTDWSDRLYAYTGPLTINKELAKLTTDSKWKSTTRLITALEVAEITGAKDKLSWTTSKDYFYFDGNDGTDQTWKTKVATTHGSSKYAWLYDNVYSCTGGRTEYGCNVADNNIYGSESLDGTWGYWTSSYRTTYQAWAVMSDGRLHYTDASSQAYGLRPVIEVPITKFQ